MPYLPNGHLRLLHVGVDQRFVSNTAHEAPHVVDSWFPTVGVAPHSIRSYPIFPFCCTKATFSVGCYSVVNGFLSDFHIRSDICADIDVCMHAAGRANVTLQSTTSSHFSPMRITWLLNLNMKMQNITQHRSSSLHHLIVICFAPDHRNNELSYATFEFWMKETYG